MVRTIFFSALGLALLGFTLVVGTNVNVSNVTGEQEEVDVAIDPTSPSHLIGGSNDVVTGVPRARVYESTNGGQSWTNALLALPQGYQYSADPAITFDRHGNAYYAFVTYNNSFQLSLFVAKKAAGAASFGAPVEVPNVQADKEFITADLNPQSPCVDNIYVAWDNNEQTAQTLRVSRSTNGGATFQNPPQVNDSGTGVIAAYPAVHPDGTVMVAWADWQNRRIMFDRSTDCGATFGTDTLVHTWTLPTQGLSYMPPGAPQRGIGVMPYLAVDHSNGPRRGRVYLVYNDRGAAGGNPPTVDVFMRYSDDKGVTWSSPIRVNDDSPTALNDQYLPRVQVDPKDGSVHVVFHDTRNDPTRRKTDVYYAKSVDGQTFLANERVTTQPSDQSVNKGSGDMDYGEYSGLAALQGRAHAFWTDNRSGDDEVYQAEILTGLNVLTGRLPPAQVGVAYSETLMAGGGTPPYTFTATGLPPGFSLAANGTVTGTPTANVVGSYTLAVTVRDATNDAAQRNVELDVTYPPLTITTQTLPYGGVEQPYNAQLQGTGGQPPYSWSATGLPASLELNASTGAITGTPTASDSGQRNVTVTLTDSGARSVQKVLLLGIVASPLRVLTTSLPPAQEGRAWGPVQLQTEGGQAPLAWSWSDAFVPPAGLSLSLKGVLSGTPAMGTAGTQKLRVTVRDASVPVQQVDATLPLVIFGPPVAEAGEDRTVNPGALTLDGSRSNDPSGKPLTYRWTAPHGVTLSDETAVAPTTTLMRSGQYPFTLVVQNGEGTQSAPDTVTITVNELAPVPAISAPNEVEVGTTVMLDGSQSTDPNGDAIVHTWHLRSGEGRLLSPAGPQTSFVAQEPGAYVVELAVTDGKGTASAQVTITATQRGCGCGSSGGLELLALGLALAAVARGRVTSFFT